MKKFVLLGFVVASTFACSSSGEEELQEAVVTSEEGAAATAESVKPEEGASEAEMALIDAKAAVATQASDSQEATTEEKTAAAEKPEQLVYPTTSLLNLRQGPGMSHSVIRVASFGEAIALTGENHHDLWLKTTDGLWVSKSFVADNKPAKAIDPVMNTTTADQVATEVASTQMDDSSEATGTDAE